MPLRKLDAAQRITRFYAFSVQPTLFGEHAVVQRWSRINIDRRRSKTWRTLEASALQQATQQVPAKRRRGYQEVTG